MSELLKEYHKKYSKAYYEINKEYYKKYNRINYEKNKEKNKEKIECSCGLLFPKNHLKRHQKSLKHINMLFD